MRSWETASLGYIYCHLFKLSHYKYRGIINYPPAQLNLLIKQYAWEDLLTGAWGQLWIRQETRIQLTKAYFELLKYAITLQESFSQAEIFYQQSTFTPVRHELVNGLLLMERDLEKVNINVDKPKFSEVQIFS